LFWVPPEKRESIRELISEIEEKLGGFILGQGLLCLIIGIMAVLAYLIIGLPYVLLLAVFAGILEAVPIFGPILGTLPAFLIALSIAPVKALQVVVAMIVIQGLENHFLVPRVMKRSVGVNSVVALLSLLAFTSFLGLAGAILAIPAAAIIQLVMNRFMLAPVEIEVNSPDGRDQLSRLRYETQLFVLDVRNQLRENEQFDNSEQDVVDKMETIAAELDQLLSNSEQISEET
jgi:predicted PurR-regulated permease PerM